MHQAMSLYIMIWNKEAKDGWQFWEMLMASAAVGQNIRIMDMNEINERRCPSKETAWSRIHPLQLVCMQLGVVQIQQVAAACHRHRGHGASHSEPLLAKLTQLSHLTSCPTSPGAPCKRFSSYVPAGI